MKKLLLIDGNSMLFRAYYATVYGSSLSSSNGIPTNAIYGFALMLSKALKVIEPDCLIVAFDHDKQTYRHLEYPQYKGTRAQTPEELKVQFPIIREYLDALHITHYEQSGLEADDIIGCLAKSRKDYEVSVLTSDKDLLQLVDDRITVYLMHKGITDIARMDRDAIYERFSLEPLQIIDMKGLAGDPSDNIPGVRNIGDKTAIKLLNTYRTVEGVYEHIEELKGKQKENLLLDQDNAFLSKHLATIITDQPIALDVETCQYQPEGRDAYDFYLKYDMKSLAGKVDLSQSQTAPKTSAIQLTEYTFTARKALLAADLENSTCFYLQGEQVYFIANEKACVLAKEDFFQDPAVLDCLSNDTPKTFYDLKAWHHEAICHGFEISGRNTDLMIAAFLLDSRIKTIDDLLNKYDLALADRQEKQLDLFSEPADDQRGGAICSRLAALKQPLLKELKEKEMETLLYDIECPLTEVLAQMEATGVCVDESILDEVAQQTSEKMAQLQAQIHEMAGHEFNINSPKQLAEVLYDELGLPSKNTKRSTDAKILGRLSGYHPIISCLLDYRKYAKIYSTYAFGLKKYIEADRKIHTVFNQCITETGRLSSSDPNLQNISIRNEEASIIRKAFVPEEGCVLVGADYSQVELRMLAHLSGEENLINAFKEGYDIHTKTAMDIFDVEKEAVTPLMRRQAKAINFGIDYGMSAFGLSERLEIPVNEAAEFIRQYFARYPKVKTFMDDTIAFCQANGYVRTLFNRRREIPEINAANHNLKEFGKRAAMNAPVQGSAADLIKIAMLKVSEQLKTRHLKSRLILQIHDELILNVPLEEKEIILKLVQDEMENALKLAVPLLAQSSWGNNWLEVK